MSLPGARQRLTARRAVYHCMDAPRGFENADKVLLPRDRAFDDPGDDGQGPVVLALRSASGLVHCGLLTYTADPGVVILPAIVATPLGLTEDSLGVEVQVERVRTPPFAARAQLEIVTGLARLRDRSDEATMAAILNRMLLRFTVLERGQDLMLLGAPARQRGGARPVGSERRRVGRGLGGGQGRDAQPGVRDRAAAAHAESAP